MAMKIAVTPQYEDEKRHFHSNRLLLIFVAQIIKKYEYFLYSNNLKYHILSGNTLHAIGL